MEQQNLSIKEKKSNLTKHNRLTRQVCENKLTPACVHTSTKRTLLKSSDRQGMALKPEKPVHHGPPLNILCLEACGGENHCLNVY